MKVVQHHMNKHIYKHSPIALYTCIFKYVATHTLSLYTRTECLKWGVVVKG